MRPRVESVPDSSDQRLTVLERCAVLGGRVGQTRVAAELAVAVVVHDGHRFGYVVRRTAAAELPHKVVSDFDDTPRLADEFGADAVRVKFHVAARLAQRRQRGFVLLAAAGGVVGPLQIEEGVAEVVGRRLGRGRV